MPDLNKSPTFVDPADANMVNEHLTAFAETVGDELTKCAAANGYRLTAFYITWAYETPNGTAADAISGGTVDLDTAFEMSAAAARSLTIAGETDSTDGAAA